VLLLPAAAKLAELASQAPGLQAVWPAALASLADTCRPCAAPPPRRCQHAGTCCA
jgi:hypothetical protein